MRIIVCGLLSMLLISLPPVLAQEEDPLEGFDEKVEEARLLLRTERRLVIATELNLTPDQGRKFWPLYGEYSTEMQKISDRKVKLIKNYALNFNTITEDFAARALSESLSIDAAYQALREIYLPRFKQILPIIQVARFYQVEKKLDAVIDFQLAAQIPLVEEPKPE